MDKPTKYYAKIRIPSNLVDKARKHPLLPNRSFFANSNGSATILHNLDSIHQAETFIKNLISTFPDLYEDLVDKSYTMLKVLDVRLIRTEGTANCIGNWLINNTYLDSYIVPVIYNPLEIRPLESQDQWITRLLRTLPLGNFVWAIQQTLEHEPLSDDISFSLPGTGLIPLRLLKSGMKFRELRGFEPLLRKLDLEVRRKSTAQAEINILIAKELSDFK